MIALLEEIETATENDVVYEDDDNMSDGESEHTVIIKRIQICITYISESESEDETDAED